MGYVIAQLVNFDYKDEKDRPVFHLSCYTKDNKRWYLSVYGKKVRPEFGVPYEEFWKLLGNEKVVEYFRGPDSPFGEPVMNVVTKFPHDVAGKKDSLINLVSHSYQGDIKFEKKCVISLGIIEGYFQFDPDKIDDIGYISDEFIQPPPKEFEKFDANKKIFYIDTEWDMSLLKNEYGEFRGGELKDKDYERAAIITMSILDSQTWVFDVFTWHPKAKEKEFTDKYVSRLPDETKQKLKMLPREYKATVHAYENEIAMLNGIISWWSRSKEAYPDAVLGYNGCGGIHGKGKDKRWINGFDIPWLYHRMMFKKIPLHRLSPMGEVYCRYGVPRWTQIDVVIKLVTLTDTWHAVEYFDITAKEAEIKDQKLDTIAEHFLKVGKVKYNYKHVWELWLDNPLQERYYNEADVEAEAAIDQMFLLSDDEYNRALYSGAKWEDGREASKLHDQINLRLYKGLFYLDTKRQYIKSEDAGTMRWSRDWIVNSGKSAEKRGGHVETIMPGMHMNIGVGDFNGFYPATSIIANCGPETFINAVEIVEGVKVVDKRQYLKKEISNWPEYLQWVREQFDHDAGDEDIQGFITNDLIEWKLIEYKWDDLIRTPGGFYKKTPVAKNVIAFNDLKSKRKPLQKKAKEIFVAVKDYYYPEYKKWDKKQFSFKGLTNARFGVTGMEADRLYMIQIFNTITLTAQDMIKECIRYITKELKYVIIGGDTDSIFLQLKRQPEWVEIDGKSYCKEALEINEAVNKNIKQYAKAKFNIDDVSVLNIEVEDINDYFLLVTKKHYIKRTIWKEGVFLPGPKPGQTKDPRIFYKGVKRVRRESAIYSAYVQDELSMIVMSGQEEHVASDKCMEFHKNFRALPMQNVCKVLALGKPLSKYGTGTEQFKAFTLANDFFNAGFVLGSRAFVVRLKRCPSKINGRKVPDNLGDIIAFTPEMLPKMIECGMEFDWDSMEDFAIAGPADEILLKRYGKTYKQLVENKTTFDPMVW